jgi:putative ABC transport system permease protein
MIKFLLKGLLRDRHRSLVPLIIVFLGVMLTVVFQSWISGVLGDGIESNARFATGHVKVMTKAYADNIDQMPNDLALLGTNSIMTSLRKNFPQLSWAERIHFAGLIDVPDASGETRAQGTIMGFGIDLLSGDKEEADRMNIPKSIVQGRLPANSGEILLSDLLAQKLKVGPGDTVSLIGSTMYGEMAVYNFVLAGTVEFGTQAMDRGTMIADLRDVRKALNMEDATGEILGFFNAGFYNDELAGKIASQFNKDFNVKPDKFSPVMITLKMQSGMGILVNYSSKILGIMIFVFLLAMSIVLWNAGLLGGLRRYGEFGMRLAIGEEKGHVYRTMIYESLLIGTMGSVAGVIVGMGLAWYLQTYGIDIGNMMKNATIIMPTVFHAHITSETWFIGFIPGVFSTLIGTMLSGIGIYKRQTAQLFKELEA